jgi:hypothetical protein
MSVSVDNFISVAISRSTRTNSRRSFGNILIAAYLTWFAERARTYAEPDEMLDDGCPDDAPEYLAAVALCAQEERPDTFKVGRRLGDPAQTLRLTPAADPIEGEVHSVTIGDVEFSVTAGAAPTVASVSAALMAAINPDVDAIIDGGASSLALQTLDTALELTGVIGLGDISPPRNLVLAINAHADWLATSITVTGLSAEGRVQTEALVVPVGGTAVPIVGTKVFSSVTSVSVPIQAGIGGTIDLGTGGLFANSGLDITASGGVTHVDIVADDAGAWFAYTELTDNIGVEDRTAVPAITLATDLAAIQDADSDWYGLIVADAQSSAQIAAIATWAETKKVLYVAHTMDSACVEDVDTDILTTLKDASRLRSKGFYNRSSHGAFPDAALLGALFSDNYPPGSASFEFKTLSGVTADALSTTVFQRLVGQPTSPADSKRAMVYVEVRSTGANSGTPVTIGGLTAGGEWLDIVRGLDAAGDDMQGNGIDLQLSVPKVPFTAVGTDALDGRVRATLRKYEGKPFNLFAPGWTTQATAVEDVSGADKQNRYYDGVRFNATVQGAIRVARFRGTVAA